MAVRGAPVERLRTVGNPSSAASSCAAPPTRWRNRPTVTVPVPLDCVPAAAESYTARCGEAVREAPLGRRQLVQEPAISWSRSGNQLVQEPAISWSRSRQSAGPGAVNQLVQEPAISWSRSGNQLVQEPAISWSRSRQSAGPGASNQLLRQRRRPAAGHRAAINSPSVQR